MVAYIVPVKTWGKNKQGKIKQRGDIEGKAKAFLFTLSWKEKQPGSPDPSWTSPAVNQLVPPIILFPQ